MMGRCDEIRDELAAYQSGEGTAAERTQIASHLSACSVCRQEAEAQRLMHNSLRALKSLTDSAEPPARIWKNAAQAWNQQDARRHVKVQLRVAFAGAFLLLFVFGAAWARHLQPAGFPLTASLSNFSQARHGVTKTEYPSQDADRAAQWLHQRLGANIPVIKMDQVGAQLIGADVLPDTSPATGRLLYKTSQGLAALYITPKGTDFGKLATVVIANHSFSEDVSAGNMGLIGWSEKGIGYGLALQKPIDTGNILAVEARRATE